MSEINTQMLKEIMPEFSKFLASEGQQWKEERKEKDEFFSKYFSEAGKLIRLICPDN